MNACPLNIPLIRYCCILTFNICWRHWFKKMLMKLSQRCKKTMAAILYQQCLDDFHYFRHTSCMTDLDKYEGQRQ